VSVLKADSGLTNKLNPLLKCQPSLLRPALASSIPPFFPFCMLNSLRLIVPGVDFQLFIYNAERLCQELITFTTVQRAGRKRERKSQSRRRNKRIQREKKTTEEANPKMRKPKELCEG